MLSSTSLKDGPSSPKARGLHHMHPCTRGVTKEGKPPSSIVPSQKGYDFVASCTSGCFALSVPGPLFKTGTLLWTSAGQPPALSLSHEAIFARRVLAQIGDRCWRAQPHSSMRVPSAIIATGTTSVWAPNRTSLPTSPGEPGSASVHQFGWC